MRAIEPLRRERDVVDAIEVKMAAVPNFLHGRSLWDIVSESGTAFFTISDVGLVGLTSIQQGKFAIANVTFWDRRLEDKDIICRQLVHFAMECAQLEFVTTAIPRGRKSLLAFAKLVGFESYKEDADNFILVLLRERL